MKSLRKRMIACILAGSLAVAGLAGCGNNSGADTGSNNGVKNDGSKTGVTINFWNPITGPDAAYMQELVAAFNKENEGEIFVNADAQAEASHYQRIMTSFTDESTADLCIVHKSRISSFYRSDKLRDMTEILSSQGIKGEDYVGDTWTSCEFDGKMYAAPYDVLPTVLFYNRNLIPEGYTEADILSEDFTVEKMLEMMKAAYVDAPMDNKKVYGMAFNYSFTSPMFISFLNQQDAYAVAVENPTVATFDCAEGYKAAEAVMSIPFTHTEEGKKVSSESGTDHLNVFVQGRALFTLDGIWSAPDACKKTEKVDAGVALLPKLDESAKRVVSADGHCFAMFKNSGSSAEKDEAVAKFMKYLIDNSGTWCQGGKVAARADIANDTEYQKLEWSYLSTKLENVISPVKVYTYDTIISSIGKYVSDLTEGRATDVEKAVNEAASEGEQAAEKL